MRQFYKNAPIAETGVSVAVFGFALWHYNKTEKENRPALIQQMLPYATPVLICIMSLFSNRFKENRECALKNEDVSLSHMQKLYDEGVNALSGQKFLLAEDNFRRARLIFEEKYASHDNVLATDLHAKCCYQNALALYFLKKYNEVKKIISNTLQLDIQVKTVKRDLLNLSALISFKRFLSVVDDDKVAENFRNESETLFRQSFSMDSSQANVTLFLHYLNDNNAFLAAMQPTVIQSNSTLLAVAPEQNVLTPMVTFLIADVYRRQGKFAEAICLFEDLLPAFQTNPGAFFDMFVIPMHGLSAYDALLKSMPTQTVLLQNTDKDGIQKISGVKKDVIESRIVKLANIACRFLLHAESFDDGCADVYRAAASRVLPFVGSDLILDLHSLINSSAAPKNRCASLFSSSARTAEANIDSTAAAAAHK